MKLLINKGADVNAKAASNSGRTALQAAAGNGHEAIVKQLINKGADVNVIAAWWLGRAALQAAVENGHETVVQLLIDTGVDVNTGRNETPTQLASKAGYMGIVELLRANGALDI